MFDDPAAVQAAAEAGARVARRRREAEAKATAHAKARAHSASESSFARGLREYGAARGARAEEVAAPLSLSLNPFAVSMRLQPD